MIHLNYSNSWCLRGEIKGYPSAKFYRPKQNRGLTETLIPCLFGITEELEVLEHKTRKN